MYRNCRFASPGHPGFAFFIKVSLCTSAALLYHYKYTRFPAYFNLARRSACASSLSSVSVRRKELQPYQKV